MELKHNFCFSTKLWGDMLYESFIESKKNPFFFTNIRWWRMRRPRKRKVVGTSPTTCYAKMRLQARLDEIADYDEDMDE